MPSSNVEVIEIGIPGPPGAGVSSSEKSDFAIKSGSNTFSASQVILRDGDGLVVRTAAGVNKLIANTSAGGTGALKLVNGEDLIAYSDELITAVATLDGATGNLTLAGELTATDVVGETFWLTLEFDGGGSALTTGVKRRIKLPRDYTIVSDGTAAWEVALDQSGSIGFDLWMDSYANYPPTSADRISGTLTTQNPRVSSAIKAQSATLTGWTTSLVKGRYLFVSIDSITTATWATLSLHLQKA